MGEGKREIAGVIVSNVADIDELMLECGLDVLHPGGLRNTDALARMCGVAAGMRVLDVGSGKGAGAIHLARHFGCTVVGVDRMGAMAAAATEKARQAGPAHLVTFVRGDALALPFEDGAFDVVLSECTTTLIDTERALGEFIRVTKRGGVVGDADMIWKREPPAELVERMRALWDGFVTRPLGEWKVLAGRLGLADVKAVDLSESMQEMQAAMMRELGLAGLVRLGAKLLARPDLRHAIGEYRRLFRDHGDCFGYGAIVGRKP